MNIGKKSRLARLFHPVSGRGVIVPLDHGATLGPIQGLTDPAQCIAKLCGDLSLVQGLVLHRGVLEQVSSVLSPYDLPARVLHLSASTAVSPKVTEKALVASVEDALRMGADAVSVHVNLGVDAEPDMLRDFGLVSSYCQQWGMPLLAMMYTRVDGQVSNATAHVAHAARLAAEMGADLVKVGYPGSAEAMEEVVGGCFIPVLIAGGEKCADNQQALQMVAQAIAGGAAGVCMGRNVFQQEHAADFINEVGLAVHGWRPALDRHVPQTAAS
ncbi:2-amino-3,7-dideoxy-D-threo-hept-6-ulosonate synthase [Paludibacterium purpuratum]|uniref:Class I fructose-bisphosphate aldolase/fructose-bisphosphate aldolase/2-amino-3,7-dideoxy-D-threo-hept-6-ulosonate synthase n=1 Tax=Paludibacterium purpuratum TaxID=1144873 RepID=A0A4R7B1F0_9NEIS|nr:2-amino-3,7-dideoxy-D-threo-hept-6-ulosonate synthase [Paludibacterium purpuratum]TDR73331.1 class I fructose-bisphosphate aldolase/fructose-bisphosphate aldolase/2-amino-3,7-dideoxy-D-threo-hept-6-ulosonate synthase [Paludibacterium purpuratum]